MPIAPEDFRRPQQKDICILQNGKEIKRDSQYGLKASFGRDNGSVVLGEAHRERTGDESSPLDPIRTSGLGEPHADMIARIKREQKLQWFPETVDRNTGMIPSRTAMPNTGRPPLQAAAILSSDKDETTAPGHQHLDSPVHIERPRSALHAGDFRQRHSAQNANAIPRPADYNHVQELIATSPPAPWLTSFRRPVNYLNNARPLQLPEPFANASEATRHRAASYSALSSSYVWRPPTSPLVRQSNSNDQDSSDESSNLRARSPDKAYRRRTFSPGSLQPLSPTSDRFNFYDHTALASSSLRREGTVPSQAHQPRRSLTSLQIPHLSREYSAPSAHSRRPSVSEHSPLQYAPLVGRYEESILRGRMSTLPSRPLDFVAQIGVFGKGDCKPGLRCPPHIIVPFPAVFYDYRNNREKPTAAADRPSPYVGQIDLESNLKVTAGAGRGRRGQSSPNDVNSKSEDMQMDQQMRPPVSHRRHLPPPRSPKGCYRIPQQGQLQIVIKNPNKTAVKLFLVPYDLLGMEPGQKTFIRQRSYSWGPIIDMPLSARKNLGTECPEAAISTADDPNERPVLRYLIHLHICCPSGGRFYLHKSIRVVFANRVPDGKEKLRVETQLPEPRFTSYKPEVGHVKRNASSTLHSGVPIFTPQPIGPASRAASAGELTHHLEDKFTLRRPHHQFASRNDIGAPSLFGPPLPLPSFDFRRLPNPDGASERNSQDSERRADQVLHSPNLSPLSNNDGMSWIPQSPLRTRTNPMLVTPQNMVDVTVDNQNDFGNGNSGRSSTPRTAGREGLLALQLKDWAESLKAQRPA